LQTALYLERKMPVADVFLSGDERQNRREHDRAAEAKGGFGIGPERIRRAEAVKPKCA